MSNVRTQMNAASGFTLIELMIVVAIVGILSAIAYPSYLEHVRKGMRAEAKAALMEGAQALERYYSVNGTYVAAGGALPAVFGTVVPDTGTKYYDIAAQGTPTRNSFALRATRSGKMSADPCGDFQLDNTGARSIANNTKPLGECW